MSTTTKTGRSHRISRKGKGAVTPHKGKTAEQKMTKKLAQRNPDQEENETPVPEIIIHSPVDVNAEPDPGRTRSTVIVYEAMKLLRKYGYEPAKIKEPSLPVNLMGMKKSGTLLICAIRSRLPVPNAAKLREKNAGKVDYLCRLAGRVRDRIMIWVYSPACGWRYYLVYPGGLRYDLDFPKSIQ